MTAQYDSPAGPLDLQTADVVVYRIGYAPDPFAWTPWQYANDGRFDGRWDDPEGTYPTARGGVVPRSWLGPRCAGTALLVGEFVDVRTSRTIATLRERFVSIAAGLDLPDLDASALKSSAPRTLTQAISGWLYREVRPPLTGVCFASRFGDALTMWAVFEQPGEDESGSAALRQWRSIQFDETTPALVEAMAQHGLTWD